MNQRKLLILLVVGLFGYAGLAYLFPRYDTSVKWGYQLSREQALRRATEYASRQGVDVTGWQEAVLTSRDRNLEQYLQEQKSTDFERIILSPIKTTIKFRDRNENRTVAITLASDGQILSYERTGLKPTEADKKGSPEKALAGKAAAELVGEQFSQFGLVSESEPEKGRRQFVWSSGAANTHELKVDIEVSLTGANLDKIVIKGALPAAYREELTRRDLASFALMGGLEFIVTMLSVIAAIVLCFLCFRRREIDLLGAILFFACTLLVFSIGLGLTTLLNELKSGRMNIQGISNPTVLTLLPYVIFAIACGLLSLMLTIFWATGEATSAKYQTGRMSVWAAALRGNIFTRQVAITMLAGLLMGGVIAVISFLLAFIARLPVPPSDYISRHDLFSATSPLIAGFFGSLIGGETFYLIMLFAFLVPLIRANIKSIWGQRILFLLVGVVLLTDLSPNQTTSLSSKLLVSVGWLTVFGLLYKNFDLLSLLAANFAAGFATKMLSLSAQPLPSLQSTGKTGLILLGVTILVSLVLARLAPDKPIEPRQLLTPQIDTAERERLKAEFSIARKAQENLLPAAAPQIPGYSIAALCRPARECGGDLYDFIPLPNGKIGIVVADVSGKGVPAALYMTLTKGVLLSVGETTSDPGEILREVNRHLYEVCKRKSFVTLFLGVLEPKTRTLTYARAGHNPPLWRRQSEQETVWLKSAGIGLGLNAGKSFDRVLKVEKLELSPNDLLIFYSDGISEAMNEHQEEYGEERLEKMASFTDGMGAEETLSAIFVNVSNFLGKVLPQDDQTLVVLRVT